MEGQPLVSIIIPVYNCGPYLAQCLDSVLSQTYANLEVIVVDDGSTDSSLEICRSYQLRDGRIKLFHKENGGQSSARNRGLDECSGDFIMFIDSDDYVSPRMVESLYRRIMEDGSDLALCNASYLYEDGEGGSREELVWKGWQSDAVWSERDFWEENVNVVNVVTMFPWNKIYPRRIFKSLRFIEGRVQEDELILDKVIRQCGKISVISESLYYYRQRKSSTMGGLSRKLSFGFVEACLSRFDHFLDRGWQDLLLPALYLAYRGLVGEFRKLSLYDRSLGLLAGIGTNSRSYIACRRKFNDAVDRYLAAFPQTTEGLVIKLRLQKISFPLYGLYCVLRPLPAAIFHALVRR